MPAPINLALVTGSAGWLGKRFSRLLATREFDHDALRDLPLGLRVRCMVLPGEDDAEVRAIAPNVEVIRGDVRNSQDCAAFCEGASGAYLFHTAGIIHPNRVEDFYRINVEGTKNLLAAAAQSGVRRMVHVSSNSPAGCNPHPDHVFDENSPYNPYMNYG